MKKTLIGLTIGIFFTFLAIANSHSVFAQLPPITQEHGVAAKATVTNQIDATPPNNFGLNSPSGTNSNCDTKPTFIWELTTDNVGVSHYDFKLWSENSQGQRTDIYSFSNLQPQNNSSLTQNNINYSLELRDNNTKLGIHPDFSISDDPTIKYFWQVAAFDAASNSKTVQTDFTFKSNCNQIDCTSLTSRPIIVRPGTTVTTAKPALVFTFNPNSGENINDYEFAISIDGTSKFTGIKAQNQNTFAYNLIYEPTNHQFSFTFLQDLWTALPQGQTAGHTIEIKASRSNCSQSTQQSVLYQSGGLNPNQCEQSTAQPILSSPSSEANLAQAPSNYEWSICLPANCTSNLSFYLNGHYLNSLNVGSNNADYSFQSSVVSGSGNCIGALTNYSLQVKKYGTNLPIEQNGKNVWGVKLNNSLVTSNFYLGGTGSGILDPNDPNNPNNQGVEGGDKCYWCTMSDKYCTSGTCEQCTQLGRNCFKSPSEASNCQLNSDIACTDGNVISDFLAGLGLNDAADWWNSNAANSGKLLQGFSTQVFPKLSVTIFLPFGVLAILAAVKKGYLFSSCTGKGIAKSLVILEKEVAAGRFVAVDSRITSEKGLFTPFSIVKKGFYRLKVEGVMGIFPSAREKSPLLLRRDYYQGQTFHLPADSILTTIIPFDLAEDDNENCSTKNSKYTLFSHFQLFWWRFWRIFDWLAGIFFGLSLIFVMIYPTFINMLVFMIYALAAAWRTYLSFVLPNTVLTLVDQNGVAYANTSVKIYHLTTENFDSQPEPRLHAILGTNEAGRIITRLHAGNYRLKVVGHNQEPLFFTKDQSSEAQSGEFQILSNNLNKKVFYLGKHDS